MTLHSFPCLLCATETRRGRFCKLGLVLSRKELSELSISLLPCPSKVCTFMDYGAERELVLVVDDGVWCVVFLTKRMFTYMVVDVVLD